MVLKDGAGLHDAHEILGKVNHPRHKIDHLTTGICVNRDFHFERPIPLAEASASLQTQF
jgi:hypothetical protein